MILWIIGNSGSGKTTLARRIRGSHPNVIHLDGDEMRRSISEDLGYDTLARHQQNIRVAKLARVLERQGFDVVVSVICPYRKLRLLVEQLCGCIFLYLPGGKSGPDYPFEKPEGEAIAIEKWSAHDLSLDDAAHGHMDHD